MASAGDEAPVWQSLGPHCARIYTRNNHMHGLNVAQVLCGIHVSKASKQRFKIPFRYMVQALVLDSSQIKQRQLSQNN